MESKKHEVPEISPSSPSIRSIFFRENDGSPLKEKDYQLTISGSQLEGTTDSQGKASHENIEEKEFKVKLVLGEEGPSEYPDNPGSLDPLDLRNRSDGGRGPVSKNSRTEESALVKHIQSMLKALGYNLGTSGTDLNGVDGDFGDITEKAVKQFQEGHKDYKNTQLGKDGEVGVLTSEALNRALVGRWYQKYETPRDLTENRIIITIVAADLEEGFDFKDESEAKTDPVELQINVAYTRRIIVRGDFLVLTKSGIEANADFEQTDKVKVTDQNGTTHSIQKQEGKVLIRPKLIVIGRFPDGTHGDPNIPIGNASMKVESSSGVEKAGNIAVRIVNPPPFSVKTVMNFGDEDKFYYIGIIANPAVQAAGKTGNDPPFTADPIMTKRPSFHKKAILVLESLLDRSEDFLKNSDIEKHLKVYALFDDSLAADADHALLRRDQNTNYLFPRSYDLSNVFDGFLKPYKENADVLALVTADTQRKLRMAWFTTDGSTGTNFTYGGTTYKHGKDAKTPGAFADHIEQSGGGTAADKMTSLHEFMHAMSEKKQRITDLYNDRVSGAADFNVNKKSRANDNTASNIPANFSEYNGTTYKSDRPDGTTGYVGRGGLGYPGGENIEASHGPELRDNTNPNIMDNYKSATDPLKCKLDKLTYSYATDRVKAKIK
jgi:hypothetical protein